MKKLWLGAGKHPKEGWVNLDMIAHPGIDVVADLEKCASVPLPFGDDEFEEIGGSHVLEHVVNTLPMMQELHRIAKNGAKCWFRLPHGGSDDAWENPTHVRPYFAHSFGYFGQPFFWREDYGFKGDWATEQVFLSIAPEVWDFLGGDVEKIAGAVRNQRNVVLEMFVTMRCVKPIREAKRELQESFKYEVARGTRA